MKKIIGIFFILISLIFFRSNNPLRDIEMFIGLILIFTFLIIIKNGMLKKILISIFLSFIIFLAILSVWPQKDFVNIHSYLEKNSNILSQYSESLISQNIIEGIWILGGKDRTILIKTPTIGASFSLRKNSLGFYDLSPSANCVDFMQYETAPSNKIFTNSTKTFLEFSTIYGIQLKDINFHLETLQKHGVRGFEVITYQNEVYFTLNNGNQSLFYTKDPNRELSWQIDYVKLAPHWYYFMGTL